MFFRSLGKNQYGIAVVAISVVVFLANAGGASTLHMRAFAAPDSTGTVRGIVRYEKGDPDTRIRMDAEPVCADLYDEPVYTERVVVDPNGYLGNVFVYVKSGLSGSKFAMPDKAPVIEQVGCIFKPHVFGVMVGQKMAILNSDPILHNIHALPKTNKQFNLGQPFQGMTTERTFDKPEIMVRFKCDIHPWMSAYVGVVDHPFFTVSDQQGRFSITDLPPGTYVLEAWHETLGTQTKQVTVKADEAVDIGFDFAPGP